MSEEIDLMCRQCQAKCCRYFCFEIDEPEDFEEFENLRWFVLHEGISVHVDEGKWFISIENKCRNLTEDGRCGDYANRPLICRQYTTEGCDATGGDYDYDELFTSAEQVAAYAREKLGKKKYDKHWAKMCGLAKGTSAKKAKPRTKPKKNKDKQ